MEVMGTNNRENLIGSCMGIQKSDVVEKNRDLSIQIIRIMAMLLIIICHFCDYSNNRYISSLGQFFNIGVFIFIFISGYLYGDKKICNYKKWLFSRVKKIMIPVYIFIVFLIFLNSALTETFQYKYLFIYLFNLQYFFNGITGGGHLWFISVILICYLLVPLLNKYKEKVLGYFKYISIFLIILSILIGLVSKVWGLLGFYIYVFYLGYFIRNKNFVKIKYWKLIVFIILGLVGRIIGKCLFDDTLFYETTITAITHTIITVSVFIFLYKILMRVRLKNNSIGGRIISFFDDLSYYIFIVHYMFIIGPVYLLSLTNNMFVNILLFGVFTLISAYFLKVLTLLFFKINFKNVQKLEILQFSEIFFIVLYKYLLAYNYRNNLILYSLIIISGIFFVIIFLMKIKDIRLKDIVVFGIFVLLTLFTVYILTSVNFVFPLMIAMSFYGENPKKIAKFYFWSLVIFFVITLGLNSINILPDNNLSRLVNGNSVIRYSLGFINPAFVMLYYIFICLSCYYAYGYSKKFVVISLFFGVILYCLSLSRTGLISLVIFAMLILLKNKNLKLVNKFLSLVVPHLFHIFLVVIIVITVLSEVYDMSIFNTFLSGRIDFNLQFYKEGYFQNLFGTRDKLTIPLDNYYLYPLVKLGIVGCLLYVLFNFLGLFKVRKFGSLMVIEIIVLLYGLGDSNVVVSNINFMLAIQSLALINPKNKYLLEGDCCEKKCYD